MGHDSARVRDGKLVTADSAKQISEALLRPRLAWYYPLCNVRIELISNTQEGMALTLDQHVWAWIPVLQDGFIYRVFMSVDSLSRAGGGIAAGLQPYICLEMRPGGSGDGTSVYQKITQLKTLHMPGRQYKLDILDKKTATIKAPATLSLRCMMDNEQDVASGVKLTILFQPDDQ